MDVHVDMTAHFSIVSSPAAEQQPKAGLCFTAVLTISARLPNVI